MDWFLHIGSVFGSGDWLQHIINGITLGGIYALIALGYTMVYGVLKFINFAHGEILMVGTYAGFYFYDLAKGAAEPGAYATFIFFIALLMAMAVSAVLGMTVERLAYRPLRKAPRLAPLLSAIGVSIILINAASLLFGTKPYRLEYPFDNTAFNIGGITVTPHQILIVVISIILMVLLTFFVNKTKTGRSMRAVSQDQPVAALMGVKVDRAISITFAIGSALAATAGFLIALEYDVYPTMGTMAGLKAFIAAVVGGIGNITGAMIGGVVLGVLENFGSVVLNVPSGLKDTIAFSVLILVLLVKPSGIMGKAEREKV